MFYSVGVFQKRGNANDIRLIEGKENMIYFPTKGKGF